MTDLDKLIRGLGPSEAEPNRLASAFADRLPHDTWEAGRVPATVRLEFHSHATGLEISLLAGEPLAFAAPTATGAFTVLRNGGETESIEAGTGRVTIPLQSDGASYAIYLPEATCRRITEIEATRGRIEPIEPGPTWLAYGDSITQGWSATDPSRSYPAIVARALGLNLHNLGFAASARGEIPVAEYMATVPAGLITLAFGTNNWSRLPTGARHMEGILRDFIAALRTGQPDTPIVVISPLLRPDAERTENLVGATLVELRESIESTTRELAKSDPHLTLLAGADLIGEGDLVDGVHPGDDGHAKLAARLVDALDEIGIRRPD